MTSARVVLFLVFTVSTNVIAWRVLNAMWSNFEGGVERGRVYNLAGVHRGLQGQLHDFVMKTDKKP